MSLGFTFDEVMTGFHVLENGSSESRFMEFNITWGPKDILQWLNPLSEQFMTQWLKGIITVDGICDSVKCVGILELKYYKGMLKYTIHFKGEDGIQYVYEGIKTNIRPWNLHKSHTTCRGRIVRLIDEKLVSNSIVYFRLRTLPKFLLSFRLCK